MPALTIATENAGDDARPHTPSASPRRPPMSPITPSLSPSSHSPGQLNPPLPNLGLDDVRSGDGAAPRLSHSTHPDQVPTIPAPPPQPLDFEDNVDVIALKSVISTLQMQSRRAEEDIRTLRDVKAEALQRPEDFARHIAGMADRSTAIPAASTTFTNEDGPGWPKLPERISVARCPPINWSQYAVNGQALDALHSEQAVRPTQGAPATFSDGVYNYNTGSVRQEEYLGPAMPYDPQRDKLGKKGKSKK